MRGGDDIGAVGEAEINGHRPAGKNILGHLFPVFIGQLKGQRRPDGRHVLAVPALFAAAGQQRRGQHNSSKQPGHGNHDEVTGTTVNTTSSSGSAGPSSSRVTGTSPPTPTPCFSSTQHTYTPHG